MTEGSSVAIWMRKGGLRAATLSKVFESEGRILLISRLPALAGPETKDKEALAGITAAAATDVETLGPVPGPGEMIRAPREGARAESLHRH